MLIHTYVRQGNIQGVSQEIAKGIDLDCVDKNNSLTPLMYAITCENVGIDMLISGGKICQKINNMKYLIVCYR